jgi:CRP/FNR family transcriptional regulator
VNKPFPHDAKTLSKLNSLGWLAPERLERISAAMTVTRVKKRDVICYERPVSDKIYVLLSGVAKLTFLNRDGERVLVSLLGPGEIFGVSSLLPQSQRSFRSDAFSDCWVGVVKPELFVDAVLGIPFGDFSRTMEATVGRWWAMVQRYVNYTGLGLRERLASALLELATKFGVQDARGMILSINVTHADLAELVGASRQRITEHLNEFERQRIIVRDGRRLILLTSKLAQFAHIGATRHKLPVFSLSPEKGTAGGVSK